MASYKIEWKKSAAKEIRNLPQEVIAEIVDRVTSLAEDPFPPGVKKLAGQNTPTGFAAVHTASSIQFQKTTFW